MGCIHFLELEIFETQKPVDLPIPESQFFVKRFKFSEVIKFNEAFEPILTKYEEEFDKREAQHVYITVLQLNIQLVMHQTKSI